MEILVNSASHNNAYAYSSQNATWDANSTASSSWNATSSRPAMTVLEQVVRGMDHYFLPILVILGLLGNSMSFVVFVRTHLRTLSSSTYLAALAVSDNGFLLCVLASWATNVDVDLYHRVGWCQAFVYLTYVFSFLSVWYIVAFTVERYIAVCFPFRRNQMCTVRRAKAVVTIMALLALAAYNFALWTSGVQPIGSGPRTAMYCSPMQRYTNLVQVLNNIDTVITLVLPSFAIIIINVRIGHQMVVLQKQRKKILSWSDSDTSMVERLNRRYAAQNAQVTHMLLVVSTIFLLLNLPCHVIRIHQFILGFTEQNTPPSSLYRVYQTLFQFVYYLNFSINFALYSLCGKNFRHALFTLLKRTKLGSAFYGGETNGGPTTAATQTRTYSPEKESIRLDAIITAGAKDYQDQSSEMHRL